MTILFLKRDTGAGFLAPVPRVPGFPYFDMTIVPALPSKASTAL
jgi:hypothetical protein